MNDPRLRRPARRRPCPSSRSPVGPAPPKQRAAHTLAFLLAAVEAACDLRFGSEWAAPLEALLLPWSDLSLALLPRPQELLLALACLGALGAFSFWPGGACLATPTPVEPAQPYFLCICSLTIPS